MSSSEPNFNINPNTTSLRQPEFHNAANSFSTAEQLLNKLDRYEASNIFSDTDTNLVQELPEGFGDETDDPRLLAELRLRSGGTSGQNERLQANVGHWNSGAASTNLPPLRQPNLTAVPAEVLGALLKNENYGTVDALLTENTNSVNTGVNARQAMDPSTGGQSSVPDLASDGGERTKTSDSAGVDPNNVLSPKTNVASSSIFSPHAKEFVPRGFSAGPPSGVGSITSQVSSLSLKNMSTPSSNVHSLEELSGYPVNPNNSYPYPSEFTFESMPSDIKNACLLDTVAEAISQLKRSPAEFGYLIKETVELLQSYLSDVETLEAIATMIITESTFDHANFAYIGGRMCGELVKGGVGVNGKMFVHALLNNCHQRFQKIISELKNQNGNTGVSLPPGTQGFTRFFGEVYMNVKMEKNGVFENYWVIGLAIVELLEFIVKTKSTDNIKFVAQVLKLVGWELENSADAQGRIKPFMDRIFNELEQLKTSKDVTPGSVTIIKNLTELRGRGWDYTPEDVNPLSAEGAGSFPTDPNPIYELPDEFDEDWDEEYDENAIFLDDEPDDVQAAYEEFLSGQSK